METILEVLPQYVLYPRYRRILGGRYDIETQKREGTESLVHVEANFRENIDGTIQDWYKSSHAYCYP